MTASTTERVVSTPPATSPATSTRSCTPATARLDVDRHRLADFEHDAGAPRLGEAAGGNLDVDGGRRQAGDHEAAVGVGGHDAGQPRAGAGDGDRGGRHRSALGILDAAANGRRRRLAEGRRYRQQRERRRHGDAVHTNHAVSSGTGTHQCAERGSMARPTRPGTVPEGTTSPVVSDEASGGSATSVRRTAAGCRRGPRQ